MSKRRPVGREKSSGATQAREQRSVYPFRENVDLRRRLGRAADARAAYDRALALTGNETERRFLLRRRAGR